MLGQLLVTFPETQPFIYGSCIIMLMNYDSCKQVDQEWKSFHRRSLGEFLDHYNAICGFSAVFHSPLLVGDAYVQTAVAIDLGKKLQNKLSSDPGGQDQQRMFAYRDYFVYHLISAGSQEIQLESLCDQKLLQIWARDKQKNTKSAEVLLAYLTNNCRPTDTGDALHMHRNNVIYHIERLSEQFGLNLNDPEARMRLLISFKILDLLK